MASRFRDRFDAGRQLAAKLHRYAGRPDVVVLALPRGGVPVASEVARALNAPLDVLVVRRLQVPARPEIMLGAVASGGARFLLDDVIRDAELGADALIAIEARARTELARMEGLYRGTRPPVRVEGRTAIVVDDGVATGSTMRAAALALASLRPGRIVAAIAVASPGAARTLDGVVHAVVCVKRDVRFFEIDELYEDSAPVSDEALRKLLAQSRDGSA